MSQFFTSASGLDARGVGPRIMLLTSPVLISAIYTEWKNFEFSKISLLDRSLFSTIGWLWLSVGIVLFVSSIVQFSRNFPKGQLLTTGMFACSRNPIYACWIVFILPAIGLICCNWLFFLSAAVMCVATLYMVKEEEKQLLEVFGDAYSRYKQRVGCIIRFTK